MATAAYEVAHLSEHFDAESHTPVVPRRRGRWLVGLALAVAGCMGVAVGVARARKPAHPLERLSTIRKYLVKAFSSRALLEETDLKATASFVWKEEGAEDPSAMGVKAVFKQGTEEYDKLELKITLAAQEGKGADLHDKLKATVVAVQSFIASMGPPGQPPSFNIHHHVEFSHEGDEAVIEITPPADEEQGANEVNELSQVIGKHTQFEAELFVGRTVQEMYKHKHTPYVLLPQGIEASVHMKVASALFDVFEEFQDEVPGGKQALAAIRALASFNTKEELLYKSTDKLNLTALKETFPSVGDDIHGSMQGLFGGMPPFVRGNFTGIDELMDGVKSMEIVGLPNKWEMVATFTNFHIAPLIHDCLAEFPGESSD